LVAVYRRSDKANNDQRVDAHGRMIAAVAISNDERMADGRNMSQNLIFAARRQLLIFSTNAPLSESILQRPRALDAVITTTSRLSSTLCVLLCRSSVGDLKLRPTL
jgi:hypothetical protein